MRNGRITRHIRKKKPSATVPKITIAELIRIEQDPDVSIFQKSLCALQAHFNLNRSLDTTFWDSFKMFEKLEMENSSELVTLLRVLFSRHLTKANLKVMGDVAYKANIIEELPARFLDTYVSTLHNNPYRAVELIKKFQLPPESLLKWYVRANQLQAAESLAQRIALSDNHVVDFIIAYAKVHDQVNVDRWISRLQAPDPAQILKLKHFLTMYNMRISLKEFGIESEPRPRLDGQGKRLVTAVNKFFAKYPSYLEDEVYQQWAQLLLGNMEVIEPMLDAVVMVHPLEQGSLTEILRHSPNGLAQSLLRKLNYEKNYPDLTPKDWCAILPKIASPDNVEMLVEQIKFSKCLTPQVVTCLCVHNPRDIAGMVLACPEVNEIQLLTAWKSKLLPEQVNLLDEKSKTGSKNASFALLRAILQAYVNLNDFVSAARWIRYYQRDLHIIFPQRFTEELPRILSGVKVAPTKLSSPKVAAEAQDWEKAFIDACPNAIKADWVVHKLK